jgi:hypothetical protein
VRARPAQGESVARTTDSLNSTRTNRMLGLQALSRPVQPAGRGAHSIRRPFDSAEASAAPRRGRRASAVGDPRPQHRKSCGRRWCSGRP